MSTPETAPQSDRAMDSKKFKAFVIATLGWDVIIAYGMYRWLPLDQWSTLILLSMIVVQGVIGVGYILSVAGLDALKALFEIITPDDWFGKYKTPGEGK